MIERSQDYRRIKKLTDHCLIVSREAYYLIATESGIDHGVMLFHPYNDALLMHVEFDKGHRGRFAIKAYREAIQWIFENTPFDIIYGEIPEENRPAHVMARSIGADFHGVDSKLRLYSLKRKTFTQEAA